MVDRQGKVLKTAAFVAGFRALDNTLPDSLACDPLAGPLGGDAWQEAIEKIYRETQGGELWEKDAQGRTVALLFAARSRFLDDQLLQALKYILPAQPPAAAQPQRLAQVVVLGAGLDSRPWRLALPPGIAWFEVDWAEAIQTKRERLAKLGAATSANQKSDNDTRYPLKAESWTAVAADLAKPGFVSELEAAGFQRSVRTVYVAEGLFMYLKLDQIDGLLKALAPASPPGSAFLADATDAKWAQHVDHQLRKEPVDIGGKVGEKDFAQDLADSFSSMVPLDCSDLLADAGWTLESATDAKGWAKASGRTPAGDIGLAGQKGKQTADRHAWSTRHWFILKASLY